MPGTQITEQEMETSRFSEVSEVTLNYAAVKKSTYQGRECLVVPTVMMTPGVRKGNHGDLKYVGSRLQKHSAGWNHKPVTMGHPTDGSPGTEWWEANQIGVILDTEYRDEKLTCNCYLYCDRLESYPRLLDAISSNKPVGVSTGLWHDVVTTNGNDELEVINIVPDHLAVLLDSPPACSIEEGAGLCMNESGNEATHNELMSHSSLTTYVRTALNNRYARLSKDGESWLGVALQDIVVGNNQQKYAVFAWPYESPGTKEQYVNEYFVLPFEFDGDSAITLSDSEPVPAVAIIQYRGMDGTVFGDSSPRRTDNEKGDDMAHDDETPEAAGTVASAGNSSEADQAAVEEPRLNTQPPASSTGFETPRLLSIDEALSRLSDTDAEVVREALSARTAERAQLIEQLTTNSSSVEGLDRLPTLTLRGLVSSRTVAAEKPKKSPPPLEGASGGRTDNSTEGSGPESLAPPAW